MPEISSYARPGRTPTAPPQMLASQGALAAANVEAADLLGYVNAHANISLVVGYGFGFRTSLGACLA
jgi:hypothetical protein